MNSFINEYLAVVSWLYKTVSWSFYKEDITLKWTLSFNSAGSKDVHLKESWLM